MPITYTIDTYMIDVPMALIVTRCTGRVTITEVREHFQELARVWPPVDRLDVLLDLSDQISLPMLRDLEAAAVELDEQIGRPLLKPVMVLMSRKVRAQARKLGVRYSFFFMRADGEQLKTLAALYDAGALRPVLDRTFPFDETLDAMAYVEQGRAKGKIVVAMPLPST